MPVLGDPPAELIPRRVQLLVGARVHGPKRTAARQAADRDPPLRLDGLVHGYANLHLDLAAAHPQIAREQRAGRPDFLRCDAGHHLLNRGWERFRHSRPFHRHPNDSGRASGQFHYFRRVEHVALLRI